MDKQNNSEFDELANRHDKRLEGSCFFGHSTSFFRRGGGNAWYSHPSVSFWPGTVCAGAILCSKCYQLGCRQTRSGKKSRIPVLDAKINEAVPIPGRPVTRCKAMMYRSDTVSDSSSTLYGARSNIEQHTCPMTGHCFRCEKDTCHCRASGPRSTEHFPMPGHRVRSE